MISETFETTPTGWKETKVRTVTDTKGISGIRSSFIVCGGTWIPRCDIEIKAEMVRRGDIITTVTESIAGQIALNVTHTHKAGC